MRSDFYGLLASYVIVNGFLCSINLYTGGYFWAIWPLVGWGLGLAFNFAGVFLKGTDSYQAEFEKWQKKRSRLQNPNISTVDGSDFMIEQLIQRRLDQGRETNKLDAIRLLRQSTKMNLRDAKDQVENFESRNPGIFD